MADDTLLLVDDEESILNSIERLFIEADLKILKTTEPETALKILKNENITILISDHLMPGIKGVDLLARVKVMYPDVIRILMTAYADLPTAIDAINKGEVFRFIVKPWDGKVFQQTVQEGIERYQIIQSLKKADESTMLSLAQTIELKDKYTRGHCNRVARYALMMSEALNLPEKTQREIRYGSWLHDCGKIGIPESILNKRGQLDDEEFEIIKNHPVWGADVAGQAQLSDVIKNVILYHHEKYDGTGYPYGIKEKDIPIEARIVAVADCFDAVTTTRSYQKARSKDEAIEIISSMKYRNFDPDIVDVFISILKGSAVLSDIVRESLNGSD